MIWFDVLPDSSLASSVDVNIREIMILYDKHHSDNKLITGNFILYIAVEQLP